MNEEWDIENMIRDMLKFCVHVRFQTEKMEAELKRILEDLNGG